MKKTPLRKCIITNKTFEKERLLRVCKNSKNEIFVDLSYKAPGRGAYVLKDIEVVKKAKKINAFGKVFHSNVDEEIYNTLLKLCN